MRSTERVPPTDPAKLAQLLHRMAGDDAVLELLDAMGDVIDEQDANLSVQVVALTACLGAAIAGAVSQGRSVASPDDMAGVISAMIRTAAERALLRPGTYGHA